VLVVHDGDETTAEPLLAISSFAPNPFPDLAFDFAWKAVLGTLLGHLFRALDLPAPNILVCRPLGAGV
jgi:hypothetical protein